MSDPNDLTTLANVKQWLAVTGLAIATITQANPAVVTLQARPSLPLLNGAEYSIEGVIGMELSSASYVITVIDPASFSIPVNASGFSAYAGGGVVGISDPLLERLITACSTYIQGSDLMSRLVKSQSYGEVRNGNGGTRLMLKNFPVTAVASLAVNGLPVTVRPALSAGGGPGYLFDEISVMVSGWCFPFGYGNVEVSYTAGYATVPADIEQACIDMIGDWFKYRDRIGQLSMGIEGQTISFTNVPIPARAKGVLNGYRAVVPVLA